MSRYKVDLGNGEILQEENSYEDAIFDFYEEANETALECRSNYREGVEY